MGAWGSGGDGEEERGQTVRSWRSAIVSFHFIALFILNVIWKELRDSGHLILALAPTAAYLDHLPNRSGPFLGSPSAHCEGPNYGLSH